MKKSPKATPPHLMINHPSPIFIRTVHAFLTCAWLAFLPSARTADPTSASGTSIPVMVTVDGNAPGIVIPRGFQGLSFELFSLLPGPDGVRLFRPDNAPLINLFRTLGIGSLRVGGNLGDRDFKQAPSEADIDSLFAFAKASGTKVVYCLRLLNADPDEQTRIAKYIWDRYEPLLECFTLGQEPSAYPVGKVDTRRSDQRMGGAHERFKYSDFASAWVRLDDAIRGKIPGVRIGGPGVHLDPTWPRRFIEDFSGDGRISEITAHLYPGGPGNKVRDTPDAGRDRMLSGEFDEIYRSLGDAVIPSARARNLGFRIEEGNNFFNGGAADVSDTFASSLWGLDCLWWWASSGAIGWNFHTGNEVAAGNLITPCRYAAFYSVPGGVQAQPLAFGIKAFDLGAKGRMIPANISSPRPPMLSAHASLDSDNVLVTLVNRGHGPQASPLEISLTVACAAGTAKSIRLTAPGGDVMAKGGVTLGGAGIEKDGEWSGKWTPVEPKAGGAFRLYLDPASALVVRIPLQGR